MPRTRRAPAHPGWSVRSVFVRTRDGPDRLADAYRLLAGHGPAATGDRPADPSATPPAEGGAPCAPPPMPGSRPSARSASRPSTASSSALRAWAEADGHELSDRHVFRDEGYCGARLDRPGLDALRDAVRDGEFEVVGVYAPTAWPASYAYQVLLLEEFRRAGCAVEFLGRAISDDPHDQLLLQIQGAVAEYERALLGERFRRGKLQKARAGQFDRRARPLRLPPPAAPRRGGRPAGRRRGRGRGRAHALRLADRGADDAPPDPQAAERRPLAPALRQAGPGRPGSSTTSSPTRSTPAPPTPTATSTWRRAKPRGGRGPGPRRQGLPPAAARGAVDPDRGPGAGRAGGLGPRPGAAGPQRRPLVPQQHAARLPAALPADLRRLRAGHARRDVADAGRRAALLPVRRQGLPQDRPGAALPARLRGRRGPGARRSGATSASCSPIPTG